MSMVSMINQIKLASLHNNNVESTTVIYKTNAFIMIIR